MIVAIDLGSEATKVAMREASGEAVFLSQDGALVRHDHHDGVPTAVAYSDSRTLIGQAAVLATVNRADLVTGFPALLGLGSVAKLSAAGWTAPPTPAEATRDFLACLLVEGDRCVRKLAGRIDGLVVAVPDAWSDGSADGARAQELLRHILVDDLGLPLVRLLPQSVSAAAAAMDQTRPTDVEQRNRTQLVCDVGARTVVAALCSLRHGTVRLLDVEEDGGTGVEAAGGTLDRRAVQAALAQAGLTVRPDEELELVRAFRDAGRAQQQRAEVVVGRAMTVERYRDTPVYLFEAGSHRLELTAGQLMRSFATTAETIKVTVSRLLARQPVPAGEELQVVTCGGLGLVPFARHAVLDGLGDRRSDERHPPVALGQAGIARGALLVAEESAPAPATPPALALRAHRLVAGRLVSARLPIAAPGSHAASSAVVEGEPLVVEMRADMDAPLQVEVQDGADGSFRPLPLSGDRPASGRYQVGLWPARHSPGVLVLRPLDGGEPTVHPIMADREHAP